MLENDVVDLRAQSMVLRRRWRVIAAMTALGLGIALALAYLQTPSFAAHSEVLIEPLSAQPPASGVLVQPDEVVTQIQVVASEPVATAVIDQLGLSDTPSSLLKSVSVSTVDVTRALLIEVTRGNAQDAADIANAFATQYLSYRQTRATAQSNASRAVYVQQVNDLQDKLAQISRERRKASGTHKAALQSERQSLLIQLTQASAQLAILDSSGSGAVSGGEVLLPATVPTSKAAPRPIRMLILGGFIGLLLGIGLAYVRDHVDDAVRDESRLRDVSGGRPVLGHIPHWSGARSKRIATLIEPTSAVSESYRALSTNVRFLLAASRTDDGLHDSTSRALLVSSAAPSEGKTSVAANLAVAASRVGLNVTLVDADLRHPVLSQLFGLGDAPGLSDALAAGDSADNYLVDVGVANLRVLPGGSVPPNPAELIASSSARELLRRLGDTCDLVILDSAPLLRVADSLELIPNVDLVLMVARNGVSRLRLLATATDRIAQVGGKLSGTVFNDVEARNNSFSPGYHAPRTSRAASKAAAKSGPGGDAGVDVLGPAPHDDHGDYPITESGPGNYGQGTLPSGSSNDAMAADTHGASRATDLPGNR